MNLSDVLNKTVVISYHDRNEGPVVLTRHLAKLIKRRAYGSVIVCPQSAMQEQREAHGPRATIVGYRGKKLVPKAVDEPTVSPPEESPVDPTPVEEQTSEVDPTPVEESVPAESDVIEVTEAAMELIEKHQLDPESIPGSGKGGRITKQDVETFLATTYWKGVNQS